jgi:phosphate transport system permease protein
VVETVWRNGVDAPLSGQGETEERVRKRAQALRRFLYGDKGFSFITWLAAVTVLVLLGGVFVSLVIGAAPAFKTFGFGFFVSQAWNPVTDHFGGLAAIYGTVVTAFLAMLIAVPVGLGIAIFLTEICPIPLRRPIGVAIELLAGVPSIIYGIWGLFIFAPILQQTLQPWLIGLFGQLSGLSSVFPRLAFLFDWLPALFAGPPYGIGIFTASLVLSIMVIPFITAISRDVFETVPPVLKEAAYGMGCTTWEVVRRVVIPYTRVGVIGGVMLGLGRALGETMAVTFVIGNAHKISASLLAPGTTISATIANEFTEAVGDIYTSSLIALGLILFMITFVVLAAARLMLMRIERKKGG